MKKLLWMMAAAMLAGSASAARSVVFGVEAFNRSVPATSDKTTVFSPVGFELDAAIMADAFDPIVKAHFTETLGTLTGIDGTYVPMLNALRNGATNRMEYVSARAFLVPDFRKVSAAYAQELQRNYMAEICLLFPKVGAECWFRNMMDGNMEDFELPIGTSKAERNSFYELVSMRASWQDPFPVSNTRKMGFFLTPNGDRKNRQTVDMMCDVRKMDLCEYGDWTLGRIPMTDGAWFYAVLPKGKNELPAVRAKITEKNIDELLAVMGSITEPNVYHGPAVVCVPKMELTSDVDLADAMGHFKFPSKGYLRLNDELAGKDFRQVARFKLDEQGLDPKPVLEKRPEDQIKATAGIKALMLNRPFLFWVYHEPTKSILIMGQYTGR